VDVHAGEGGQDSKLFARDLLSAYLRFAEKRNLQAEIVYDSDSSWSILIKGENCWETFSAESGKHVVQRIPPTESKGRRHTSVVAVAVLPLFQEARPSLCLEDVQVTTQRGHGKGGQHQNKVESAVRAVHKPTGLTVFINGRDQYRNKQLALEILQARVSERKRQSVEGQRNAFKMKQLGYGSRSGKIRTYNFINSMVIDHRTGKKTHRIDDVMKGEFDLLR
jgi:peptide chain release factor 1